MTEDLNFINILHSIGTPVAIIAATAISILLRTISHKLSIAGGVITLLAVGAYIPIDLAPKVLNLWGETKVQIEPNSFQAFSTDLLPTEVSIVVKRGTKELQRQTIQAPRDDFFVNKQIILERKSEEKMFLAKVGNMIVGSLSDDELAAKGFTRKVSQAVEQPKSISDSKRIFVGHSWSFDNTALGKLELSFEKIKQGKAVLKLSSSSYGTPQPEVIELSNKEFKVQSFEGNFEATIKIREADFTTFGEEWVALTVIIT